MIDGTLAGLATLHSGQRVATVLGLSVAAWLCEATMYALVGLGFGLGLPPQGYLLALALANLGTLVPSAPGYVGTFDALAMLALRALGVTQALAASYTIVLHAALVVPVVLLGLWYAWGAHLSLRHMGDAKPWPVPGPAAPFAPLSGHPRSSRPNLPVTW